MSSAGLDRAREKMEKADLDPVAVETFAHYYRLLEHGETGMIEESANRREHSRARRAPTSAKISGQALRTFAPFRRSTRVAWQYSVTAREH